MENKASIKNKEFVFKKVQAMQKVNSSGLEFHLSSVKDLDLWKVLGEMWKQHIKIRLEAVAPPNPIDPLETVMELAKIAFSSGKDVDSINVVLKADKDAHILSRSAELHGHDVYVSMELEQMEIDFDDE